MKGIPKPGRPWASWSVSILLHAALAGAVVALWFWNRSPPVEQRLAIEATVVSSVPATMPPAPDPAPDPAALPVEESPPPEPSPPEPDEAAQAAEAARVAEERRVADERLAAERRAEEAEVARKAEQAAQEKAAREKAERERREKERADREKADREKAERERLAREKAEKEQADRLKAQREADLSAQLAAEERVAAARASGQMAQYIGLIANRIERAWIRPATARVGLKCEVRVTQVPGGAVTGVQVGRCNGDESVRQSIEAAVYRASPLPEPPDPALFERNLVINFEPRN